MRKPLLLLAVAVCAVLGQSPLTCGQERASAVVPASSSTYRLVLAVAEPPESGDTVTVTVSTYAVTTKLITPGGQTITAANAKSVELEWEQGGAHPSALGSRDVGQLTFITFRKRASAGRYTVEFTFHAGHQPAKVEAQFVSQMGDYLSRLRSAGGQISKPAPFGPSATVTLDLPEDREQVMFDVVVPDLGTYVSLVLPDGRKIRPDNAEKSGAQWMVATDPKESMLFAMDLLMPLKGVHETVWFDKAAKGRYEVHASPKTAEQGELRVSVVPLKAFAQALGAKLAAGDVEAGEVSRSGDIQIRTEPLPFEAFVGDKLDFEFELLGDVGRQPPQFEIREERSAWLRDTETGVQFAPPDPVKVLPVQLTEVKPRTYRGTVIPTKPGSVRITVRATGKMASGAPFTTETLLTNSSMTVKPVAARFLGITAKAIAPKEGAKFDRLEVSASLDVLLPGEYLLLFNVSDAAGAPLREVGTGSRATLQAGRQSLTASVSSNLIWTDLRSGPLEIKGISISRTAKSTMSWIDVPTANATFKTAAYQRDQWNPGPIYGEDHVTWHGIYPAASGKFQFAEVEWEVTTPGGSCSWGGGIQGAFGTYNGERVIPEARASEEGTLPPGATKVSLIFDGALINRFGKQDWKLLAGVSCEPATKVDDAEERLHYSLTPPATITFNPDEYEPAHGSFWLWVQPHAVQLSPGETRYITVFIRDKTSTDIRFGVTDLPKGVDGTLSRPLDREGRQVQSALKITASPETMPGRYFVSATATLGTEVVTSKFVLDIVAKQRIAGR